MDTFPADSWLERLERILAAAENRDPGELIREIADLAAKMGVDAADELLSAHPELLTYKPALTNAFQLMINRSNIAEAKGLLKQNFDGPVSFKDAAVERAGRLYNCAGEIFDYADFRDCRRVAMVGCGRTPFTCFHIHDKTAVPEIIGLDNVPEIVETANAVAAKLGYKRMHAELCDGRDYDYGEAQIVYVASMVSPKVEVVTRIADTAPENVQIIIWEPYSLERLWQESVEHALDPRLEITARGSLARGMSRDIFVKRRRVPTSPGPIG